MPLKEIVNSMVVRCRTGVLPREKAKKEVAEEYIEKNVNQLEYDNEFCSRCEERFGVLESAY